jgi:ABC-type dipeptide/oligopeptide/nickel transport system permease subunit
VVGISGLVALLLIVSLLGPPHTEGSKSGVLGIFQIAWDMRNLVLAFSLGAVFGGSRIVRGVSLSLKNAEYVTARARWAPKTASSCATSFPT